MMMGIYLPDSGEIKLRAATSAKNLKIDRLSSGRARLYKRMKVMDTLLYFAEIKGKTGKDIERAPRTISNGLIYTTDAVENRSLV